MSKIYLPIELNSNQCPVMVSDGHIRVYDRIPNGNNNDYVHYYDFYIRDDYIKTEGTQNFYYNSTLNCMDKTQFTTDVWSRLDIDKIVIIFFILLILCIYFPYKILSRLFGRWFKL